MLKSRNPCNLYDVLFSSGFAQPVEKYFGFAKRVDYNNMLPFIVPKTSITTKKRTDFNTVTNKPYIFFLTNFDFENFGYTTDSNSDSKSRYFPLPILSFHVPCDSN